MRRDAYFKKSPLVGRNMIEHGCWCGLMNGYGKRNGNNLNAVVAYKSSLHAGHLGGKFSVNIFELQCWKHTMPGSDNIFVILREFVRLCNQIGNFIWMILYDFDVGVVSTFRIIYSDDSHVKHTSFVWKRKKLKWQKEIWKMNE